MYQQQKFEQSISYFQLAISQNEIIEAYASYYIGYIYTKELPDFKQAQKYLLRAYELQQNRFIFFKALYQMYLQYQKTYDAFDVLDKHHKNNPYCLETHYEYGKHFCYIQKQLGLAEDAFKYIIDRNPSYARAYNRLGQVYFFQGKDLQANEQFLKALQIDSNLLQAHFNLKRVKDQINVSCINRYRNRMNEKGMKQMKEKEQI